MLPSLEILFAVTGLADYEVGQDSPGLPKNDGLLNEIAELKAQIKELTGVEPDSSEISLSKINSLQKKKVLELIQDIDRSKKGNEIMSQLVKIQHNVITKKK